jgi:hypothetical protein
MRRHFTAAKSVLAGFSLITLCACGPDDGTSASADQNNAAANAGAAPVTQLAAQSSPQLAPQLSSQSTTPVSVPALPSGASAAPGNGSDAASADAVQSVETSLAADSQQVSPVMHYAPGDSDQNSSRN